MPGFVWHWNVFFTNFTPGHFMLFWWLRKFWLPMHSGGNLGVRLGLELDKNIFKSIQKYFKSIQKYLTHTNSGLAHPKLFGSKYFWYVKYFYSYMSLFGQKLKFCFLCPMKTNFGKKWWKHKCLPNPAPYSQRPPLNTNRIPIWPNQACFPTVQWRNNHNKSKQLIKGHVTGTERSNENYNMCATCINCQQH